MAEGGGDSVEAARPVPVRTWTVSVKKPPGRAPDAVRAALQVYTRKLRARLRSGVKHRKGGAGYKVNAANVAQPFVSADAFPDETALAPLGGAGAE